MKFHSFKDIENKVPKQGSFKHVLMQVEAAGVGKITKQNTTADVKPGETKRQAAKFGNKVDKDGRPPTLSKKVKGSKTNVLFNLGMTESVDNSDELMLYYAKMAENIGELASTSKVFVDMDGVLADFFGEWQKLIGKDWRKVKDIEPALQKIRDTDDFWLNLPLLPQAKNLLGVIKKVKGSYSILSSPLPNDPNSEPHKREWIKKNLDFFPPENVIITHDKAKFATNPDGTPNILIDDFGKNIASWEAAGGEGFKHKDHKFERTAKAIKQHMSEPAKEGLGAVAKGAVSNVKNAATAGKLILKYHQTGLEADAFAAIKHGWQWIKNPTMRSKIVNMVKKYAEKHGEDWPTTVAHIKKNTGIDVSNVNEMNEKAVSKKQQQFFGIVRAMQKGDMPKGGEAGEVAKDMKKSDVKKFASTKHKGLPKKKKSESYTRDQLPQIRKKHLESIPHKIVSVKVESIIPVQKERLKENYTKQLKKIAAGKYAPIVVDSTNRIINGHHRYDVVKMLQMESITVAKLPYTLEFICNAINEKWSAKYKKSINCSNPKGFSQKAHCAGKKKNEDIEENFADGKKKGKSRPGRVKRSGASCNGSVTSLRKRAKNASGEKAKMYHWCANMKSGRKKSESYTREQFYNILVESTPQQLEEGIKDQLAKLPKNMLAKVQPIIKKIPKTGKSLVLIATLLGVMVNAVAAGDMAKADAQVDKLNNMTTMSTTADAPTKADKGGFDLDDVNYDRNYKGDVNKVFKVQDTSVKDAKAMYDKLGGVSNANYEKMKDIVFKKIDDLRSDYQDATAKKGLSGKDALHSDEFKDFRKQSNDLKIMLSKAMEIMTKDAGATGSILKPTGKILGKG